MKSTQNKMKSAMKNQLTSTDLGKVKKATRWNDFLILDLNSGLDTFIIYERQNRVRSNK